MCSESSSPWAEAEEDRLEPVIVEQGAAEDALIGRLGFLGEIADVGVVGGHLTVLSALLHL